MLSEQEKREMKEMAASAAVREEFEQLRKLSQLDPDQPVDLDRLMDFLSTMTRFGPQPPPREPVPYPRARL